MSSVVPEKYCIGQKLWQGSKLRHVKVYGRTVQESYNKEAGPYLITYNVVDLASGDTYNVPQWDLFPSLGEAVQETQNKLNRLVKRAEDAASELEAFVELIDAQKLTITEKEQ